MTARIEAGNILYLRVAGFDSGTPAALTNAVQDLRQRAGNKVIGFILDLRNNPGGAFEAAVAVADAFIDKGDIVVIKGRKPGSLKRISATPGDIAQGLPIVALINGGTAREAELVAAGLQDNRRAVLVGTRSFGESSIESLIPLQGNGAIRLTTARFMTPSGQRIQGKGLTPDLTVMPLEAGETSPGRPAARGRSARRSEEYRPGARWRQGFGRQRIRAARTAGSLARDRRHWLGS